MTFEELTFEEFLERYKYKIPDDYLGGGGFGKVYKAFDDAHDKWVALKIAEVHPGQENLSLKKEVEIASKIPPHRNIANYEACHRFVLPQGVFDYGVLQYYEDGNLSQLISAKQLSNKQRIGIAKEIIRGLAHLHKYGIIHQDMKSANILMAHRKRSQEYIPKITDFGLSKEFNANDKSFIVNSIVAGTMVYGAPEQMAGKDVRKNADLWSLGVILFELFTGKVPFYTTHENANTEDARAEIIQQIRAAKLPETINMVPQPFKELIQKCIVVDPAKRLKSVEQIWDLLKGKEPQAVALEDIQRVGEDTHILEAEEEVKVEKATPVKPVELPPTEPPRRVEAKTKDVNTIPDLQPRAAAPPAPARKNFLPMIVGLGLALVVVAYLAYSLGTGVGGEGGGEALSGDTTNNGMGLFDSTLDTTGTWRSLGGDTNNKGGTGDQSGDTRDRDKPPVPKPVVKEPTTRKKDKTTTSNEETNSSTGAGSSVETPPTTPPPPVDSPDDLAWAKAQAADTPAAYDQYLKAFPNGRYATDAKRAYMRARKKGSTKPVPAVLKEIPGQMVRIAGGSFEMGCSPGQDPKCTSNEQPAHQVRVAAFSLSRYEVTQAQWMAVMGNNPSPVKNCPNCPVSNVSYEDALDFIDKLKAITGVKYRLPSEAEWEFAAKGGNRAQATTYAGNNDIEGIAWYSGNGGGGVHVVGRKTGNELGLRDMTGNVWEWTADCYSKTYDGAPNQGYASQKGSCNAAALRGGSYKYGASNCRNTNRRRYDRHRKQADFGFRLAK